MQPKVKGKESEVKVKRLYLFLHSRNDKNDEWPKGGMRKK